MTNTKSKTTKTVKSNTKAEKLTKIISSFDMKAALSAGKSAPKKAAHSGNAKSNECLDKIKELLKAAPEGLTMNQIKTAYFAGLGIESPDKKQSKAVYETVFQHSDACHNKNRDPKKAIFTRSKEGVYKSKE